MKPQTIHDYLAEIGKKGARQRWESTTPEAKEQHVEKLQEGRKSYWASLSEEDRKIRIEKLQEGRSKARKLKEDQSNS